MSDLDTLLLAFFHTVSGAGANAVSFDSSSQLAIVEKSFVRHL
jgi:hypothetical protein